MRYFRINIYNNNFECDVDYFNFGLDEIDEVFKEWLKKRAEFPNPNYVVSIYLMEEDDDDCVDYMIDDITPMTENKDEFINNFMSC